MKFLESALKCTDGLYVENDSNNNNDNNDDNDYDNKVNNKTSKWCIFSWI